MFTFKNHLFIFALKRDMFIVQVFRKSQILSQGFIDIQNSNTI